MSGRKLRLSVHRKNEKRPKELLLPVQISLQHAYSVMTVSLPLSSFETAPLVSLTLLQSRLSACNILPQGWLMPTSEHGDLVFCKLGTDQLSTGEDIQFSLKIHPDFTWTLHSFRRPIDFFPLQEVPSALSSVAGVKAAIASLQNSVRCVGNDEAKFLELAKVRKGNFKDMAGAVIATVDGSTIRHINCSYLIGHGGKRCDVCKHYRKTLTSMLARKENSTADRTAPDSHVNYRFLTSPEKKERIQRLHTLQKQTKLQLERIKAKIAKSIEDNGIEVDDDVHDHLVSISQENAQSVLATSSEDSFRRIFWEQQKKAASFKNAKSMKWHPLMIKWCLYLRHLSGRAYELLRESGCVTLPSQRTLRDYTYYVRTTTGFSSEGDQQMMTAAKIGEESTSEWQKCVVMVMDEMYIKEDLVYNKHTGELVGFANLGDTNEHLIRFQQTIEGSNSEDRQQLAKTMLVFMIRGLFSSMQYPYVQFACRSLSGDQLFDLFWEAIYRLERMGLKVLAATADGASTNRKLFNLHRKKRGDVTYRVSNPYATDDRFLYFFSDPPHLLKTVRNAWANSKRQLWCKGNSIAWSQILSLYYSNMGANKAAPGLCLATKLKREHVYLTSFSKMRVDLAAQVLSESVGNALRMKGVYGTAIFADMFDKFFDCVNVNSYTAGKHERKVFKQPYRSATDFRLKWLQGTFLKYLDDWEKSVKDRDNFTDLQKKKMLLSRETLLGLKMTVLSFVELVPLLFEMPGVKFFLSERICQDPLEKFFGCQRQRGGAHDNPNVDEFTKNTQALRVINSFCKGPVRGNCSRKREPCSLEDESKPLPKRKRAHR